MGKFVRKLQLAGAWLNLAASCAKVPVKYEADQLKQQQKQEEPIIGHDCGGFHVVVGGELALLGA